MKWSALRRHAVLVVALSTACNAPLVLAELPGDGGSELTDASPPPLGEQADVGADEEPIVIQNEGGMVLVDAASE